MMDAVSWGPRLLSSNAPALPQAWAMQLALTLGWALVLALLGTVLGSRLPLLARRLLAGALAVWTFLPGTLTPDYWLGLAFHAPSLSAMLLCLVWLRRRLFPAQAMAQPLQSRTSMARWSLAGGCVLTAAVLLGYVLLLDTFAVLPLQLYAWGFSPALLLGLLALSLLPWLLRGHTRGVAAMELWVAPVALLLFATTRLPTGNVWDALLDPWLWLVLQLAGLRYLIRRWRA